MFGSRKNGSEYYAVRDSYVFSLKSILLTSEKWMGERTITQRGCSSMAGRTQRQQNISSMTADIGGRRRKEKPVVEYGLSEAVDGSLPIGSWVRARLTPLKQVREDFIFTFTFLSVWHQGKFRVLEMSWRTCCYPVASIWEMFPTAIKVSIRSILKSFYRRLVREI